MTAAANQDFTLFSGDAAYPIFTVSDGNSTAIDLSSATAIAWTVKRNLDDGQPTIMSKTLANGGITLIGGGTTGKLTVNILPSDTATLTLAYWHELVVTDAAGNPATVATGQMSVRPKPVATYSGDPSQSPRDMARTLVGDTDMDNALFTDQVYDGLAASLGGPYYVAAQLCRMLAQRYSGKAGRRVGDFSINSGEISRNYRDMASDLQAQADMRGSTGIIYAAGISKTDMAGYSPRTNPDRNRAFTTLHAFDDRGASGGLMPPNGGGDP